MERLRFKECENCKAWKGHVTGCFENCMKPFNALEEFNIYKGLEEQGRLLKLPCAVGDTVYQHMIVGVDKDKRKPIYKIFEATVFKFSFGSCGLCFWTETTDEGKHQNEVPLSAFNKTVFLTKSAAEQALKEMAIKALEEIQQYRAIGTVEECREAMERQRAKKPIKYDKHYYKCVCGAELSVTDDDLYIYGDEPPKYCEKCGQAIDWNKTD